jgi:hypothetical protein
VHAVAASDPAAAEAMLAAIAVDRLGEATLAAIDAGLPAEALHAKWPNIAGIEAAEGHPWRALEARRLARTDLDAALEAEQALPEIWSHDADASLAVAARLAKADPERALAHANELTPDCDCMSWLLGCVRGAPDRAGSLVDRWIDHLAPATYDPYQFFRGVLEACIRLGDAARVRRLCERGGPTGWQIAHAARWDLAHASNRTDLLDACLARYKPGCVAGRAVDGPGLMMAVGKVVIRPQWLQLDRPHPVETLSIVAALGSDGPSWHGDALP